MPRYVSSSDSVKSSDKPYYVPPKQQETQKGGLLSKIKGFFTQSTTNKSKQQVLKKEQVLNHEKSQLKQNPNKINPVAKKALDSYNISNIDLTVNSNLSFTSRNPNDTLSEFFNRKGDAPLNDIEVEGVMSLIRKAQSGSAAPSRNTSMIAGRSMMKPTTSFLMDSLTSFDANNTTVLRKASSSLKRPVTVATPTFKARTRSSTNNANTSISTQQRDVSARNISFNSSGIRKRRIVSYNTLETPYNLKHGGLKSFIERKKAEDRKKTEDVSSADKSEIVYNGGIIDLNGLDAEVEKGISKTASGVLSILNELDEKKKEEEKRKEQKIEEMKIEKKQSSPVKPVINSSKIVIDKPTSPIADAVKEVPKPAFSFSTKPAAVSVPAFSFSTKPKEEEKKSTTINPPNMEFKPLSPMKTTENKPKLAASIPEASVSPISFAFTATTPVTETESTKETIKSLPFAFTRKDTPEIITVDDSDDEVEEVNTKPEEIESAKVQEEEPTIEKEIIDSFIFPEPTAPTVNIVKPVEKSIKTEEKKDSTSLTFDFPVITPASPEHLKEISNLNTEDYSDVFTF